MSVNWSRFICISIMIAILWLIRLIEMPIRGFWCDDHTIRYPHIPMIVDYRILLAVCVFFPLALFRLVPSNKSTNADDNDIANDHHLAHTGPNSAAWDYIFGFLINLILTTYCKLIIARPRPNFYEICQPTVKCELTETRFISDFNCTTELYLGRNSIQSFFSGHSSTGTYAGLFTALHVAAHSSYDYNIKALVCSTLILFGLFPGLTQYLNHWHHWSDIAVGQLVGILLAVAAFQMRHLLSVSTYKKLSNKSKVQLIRD